MRLTPKTVLIIGLVALLSFPVMYAVMLYYTGNLRVEIGPRKLGRDHEDEIRLIKNSATRDSLAAHHTQAYKALQRERKELERERERLSRQQEQIHLTRNEMQREREELQKERERLEKLVAQKDELQNKRIKQWARVYGAMRPAEAARILETLDDQLFIQIMNNISDDRQKGKILAAISPAKAARVSRKVGTTAENR